MRKLVDSIFPICFFATPLFFLMVFLYAIIKSGGPMMTFMVCGVSALAFLLGMVFGVWLDNCSEDEGDW